MCTGVPPQNVLQELQFELATVGLVMVQGASIPCEKADVCDGRIQPWSEQQATRTTAGP